MKRGLVLGKFMPVHNGHLSLIDFALKHCDQLLVLLCYHADEPISGLQRKQWLESLLLDKSNVVLITYNYNKNLLTDSSETNPSHAKKWAEAVKTFAPKIDIFFSSEAYGDSFALHLNSEHKIFDEKRHLVSISASAIRQRPITYWEYLPKKIQPFFVKKVVLLGSESTGKSTLANQLATYYHTVFVPEMAREVIGHTEECTYEDLLNIATHHANRILFESNNANRILICDTDITITKSYSNFLFEKSLIVPDWIKIANQADLYLFLDIDCPYVQDGTRVSEQERASLSESHKRELDVSGIPYKVIHGNWQERFEQACKEIDQMIRNY